jgi:hypothetical protein
MSVTLDLARDILDRRLLDRENDACGKVDDVELEFDGKSLRLTYLLSGPGAAAARFPRWLATVYRWIAGSRITRIPWSDVLCVSGMVHLRKTASELGLDRRTEPDRKGVGANSGR